MIFYDTETCGRHGLAVLIQYAEDDGPIHLHHVFREPARKTMDLIEWFMDDTLVGFNLAFDHFHLCKLYTTFSLLTDLSSPPTDFDHLAELEERARFVDLALKPKSAFDLMLHARKGPYQSLMRRKPIVVRRVPVQAAKDVYDHLKETITFDPIYGAEWQLKETKNKNGEVDENFRDILLVFKSSTSLKALTYHALGKDVTYFDEIAPTYPVELGYAPYAKAVAKPPYWIVRKGKSRKFAWPKLIRRHVDHWYHDERAKDYATEDVVNTRDLYHHFLPLDPKPELGDDDSTLACQVAAVRWRGFKIDTDRIQELYNSAKNRYGDVPHAPGPVKRYVTEGMSEIEAMTVHDTKNATLETIIEEFEGEEPARRAEEVRGKRAAMKEADLLQKLLRADRFHASMKVIGTKSSRMSGADGLNPQAINRESEVRDCFTLADEGFTLSGGDFEAFEVVLNVTAFPDSQLEADLKTGKKLHAITASRMFPDYSYEDVLATKGKRGTDDKYTLGKNGMFTLTYVGHWTTLVKKYRVEPELAKEIYAFFRKQYRELVAAQEKIIDRFCTLKQYGNGKIELTADPAEYVTSITGFRRYYTLENQIFASLLALAKNTPKEWNKPGKVIRREREQTVRGAITTALYAACFNLQATNMRSAVNHVAQSAGAEITKRVQRRVWDIQPCGVHPFVVMPANIHDEVLCPNKQPERVARVVKQAVEEYRKDVPLIKLDWSKKSPSWGALK